MKAKLRAKTGRGLISRKRTLAGPDTNVAAVSPELLFVHVVRPSASATRAADGRRLVHPAWEALPSGWRERVRSGHGADHICDIDGLLLRRVHFGVAALTPCTVATLPHARLRAVMDRSPAIRDVFWWLTFVENAVSVEWTTSLARRSATERLSHLLCELLVRLEVVGLTENNGYALPLTQEQIADALGVSTVHVNRTLQELRALGLISLEGRRLTIHDWEGLKGLAGFSPDYLHVEGLRPPARPAHH